ncbi:MAG: LEA type 2 family protein [Calditrichaeota bacterium]|nr:LEA type 2 family protein [Calditrichota bacterium]
MKTKTILLILLISLPLIFSCAALQQLANVQKPQVKVGQVRLTNITFDKVDLAIDLNITNPNPVAATLAGFDYNFLLNGQSFLTGNQAKQTTISANGQSTLQIPLSLTFKKIYDTYKSLKNSDNAGYKIAAGLTFDLPILGKTRIPVQKTGQLPLAKIPSIKLSSLKLKSINFSSAKVELQLKVDNPNAFSLNINKLNYDFLVNNKQWGVGQIAEALQINQKGSSIIKIPLSLNFVEIGRTVYSMLTGKSGLNYQLKGDAALTSSLKVMPQLSLPFNRTGNIKISR